MGRAKSNRIIRETMWNEYLDGMNFYVIVDGEIMTFVGNSAFLNYYWQDDGMETWEEFISGAINFPEGTSLSSLRNKLFNEENK